MRRWRAEPENAKKNREASAKWREENPGANAEYLSQWRKDNRERVYGHIHRRRTVLRRGVSPAEYAEWVRSAEKVCFWCGVCCGEKFHVDHIEPLSRGGEHEIYNLVVSCPRCNSKKGATDPSEFLERVLADG